MSKGINKPSKKYRYLITDDEGRVMAYDKNKEVMFYCTDRFPARSYTKAEASFYIAKRTTEREKKRLPAKTYCLQRLIIQESANE